MFLSLRAFSLPQRGGALMLAAAAFAVGLTTGALVAPGSVGRSLDAAAAPPAPLVNSQSVMRSGHPAEVLRVIDGDTFEARVRIWPGTDITTKIRLRGIDAAELHARCDEERLQAVAAREALVRILAEGSVGVSNIGQDKYGGRVDADVSTARTADVSVLMLDGGFARRYSGGRRESWCG
jgi:endonuclease YncB( thermonuclease family)